MLVLFEHFVSIPYRLATNAHIVFETIKETEFQFLIGWLQTFLLSRPSRVSTLFQFLIGWLQTKARHKTAPFLTPFQFLIGWLQTVEAEWAWLQELKFQFLIGWLQTSPIISIRPPHPRCFNSL